MFHSSPSAVDPELKCCTNRSCLSLGTSCLMQAWTDRIVGVPAMVARHQRSYPSQSADQKGLWSAVVQLRLCWAVAMRHGRGGTQILEDSHTELDFAHEIEERSDAAPKRTEVCTRNAVVNAESCAHAAIPPNKQMRHSSP